MYNIYIVDDESDLLELLKEYLERAGYAVKAFSDGRQALASVHEQAHLWLLDIMLADDVSGYDILKALRAESSVPVIFMSARSQQIDRIMGLEMGSDDYIPKPFSPREVVLRVDNVIRRVYGASGSDNASYAGYSVNLKKRQILKDGQEVDLTAKEMDIALYLFENRGVAFTRGQLLEHVWGADYYGSDRVVDDLVKRVRKKLPEFDIETMYGYGYRLK